MDFSKPFDALSHSIILDKMSSIQLDKYTMLWVKNWLPNRAQEIIANEVISGLQSVISGVTHGSILEAVLFNVFINI